jgi:aspartate/methionine/tyrosine aminotransferase
MDLLARARALEVQGHSIIHMEIGEPDFPTPRPIVAAGMAALAHGDTFYTPALGLPELRAAIAGWYATRHGVNLSAARLAVTAGASGALLLALGALIGPGDEILLADPGYPCNRHFARFVEGKAVGIPVDARSDYQLTADLVARHWTPATRAVLLASPANPTGTLVAPEEMRAIHAEIRRRGGTLLVDEIYHGLVYGESARTALELGDDIVVINSFSKYFQMTGWRLGWLVAPPALMPEIDKLAQNLFLAASTPAQHAALAAFGLETVAILEERRVEFQRRRDFLLPALRELGFAIPVVPAGAFYLYADCSRFTDDSHRFALNLLERAGVAITPGIDFGSHRPERHVRFAYTTSMDNLAEGVARIRRFLGS